MKKFEELELTVRYLKTNEEIAIDLPTSDPLLLIKDNLYLTNEDGVEYEFDEDEIELVDIEDATGLFNKLSFRDINEINDIAQVLTELNEIEAKKFLALFEIAGLSYDIDELIEEIKDCELYEDITAEDYYYLRVEDGEYGEISENLMDCIDFEKFAKKEMSENYVNETSFGVLVN
jgi:hypothetical protein